MIQLSTASLFTEFVQLLVSVYMPGLHHCMLCVSMYLQTAHVLVVDESSTLYN